MEIRLRPLVALLAFVTLVVLAGVFVVPQLGGLLQGSPPPIATPRPLVDPAAAATQPAPAAADVAVTYADDSLLWDWQATCAPAFRQFLARELAGEYVRSLRITLVDYREDGGLLFNTAWPNTRVVGNCANTYGDFACQVAIAEGAPGSTLNAAVAMNTPYTLLEMFKVRRGSGSQPADIRAAWTMTTTFASLISPAQEPHQWQSACLTLSRVQ